MGFTTDSSQRAEILSAIDRMSWSSASRRLPYFTSPALAAVVDAVVHHQRPLRSIGIAQLSGGRRLIGLHDSVGTRRYVLDLDSEAIYVLAELAPHRLAIPGHNDVADGDPDPASKTASARTTHMSESHPSNLVTVHRGRCRVSTAPSVGGNERHARCHLATEVFSPPPLAPAPQRVRDTQRQWILQALIAAYHGDTYRLLRELADTLGATVAYIDRATVEAHLERHLSDPQWAAVNNQFTAMDFDDHIGDQGRLRTDWIETLLTRAGVPGYNYTADGQPRRDQGHAPI